MQGEWESGRVGERVGVRVRVKSQDHIPTNPEADKGRDAERRKERGRIVTARRPAGLSPTPRACRSSSGMEGNAAQLGSSK